LETFKKIIFNRNNLVIFLFLTISQIGYYFFYFGMQGSMERTGYNFGLNLLFIGIT